MDINKKKTFYFVFVTEFDAKKKKNFLITFPEKIAKFKRKKRYIFKFKGIMWKPGSENCLKILKQFNGGQKFTFYDFKVSKIFRQVFFFFFFHETR